jgi:hypothetical protein
MKHLASRLSAAALLCCTLFPLFTQAQEPTYPQPVSEYAEETGPGTMAFLSYPKYYKNTQGHLVEVVTDLVPSVDPAWDYEVQTGIWHLKVKKDGTFQASHAGDTFTYRFNSLGLGRGSQFKKVDLGEPDFSQVSVIGDTIRWSEIYPDVDLAVRYLHDILKVDVVVKKEFLRDLKAEVKAGNLDKNDYLTARFDIPQVLIRSQAKQNGQDKDLYKEALDVDQPVYFEKEGKVVHKLRPVETYLLDEQGEPVLDPEQPIRSAQVWQLKHKEAGTAEMSALLEDLADLPDGDVIIDPSVTYGSFNVATMDAELAYNSGTNCGGYTTIPLSLTDRAVFTCDVSGLGIDKIVTDARLRMWVSANTLSGNPILRAFNVTSAWQESGVDWYEKSTGVAWSTAGGDFTTDSQGQGGIIYGSGFLTNVLNLTTPFNARYPSNITDINQKGFLIKLEGGTGGQITFLSKENSDTTKRWYYEITYNTYSIDAYRDSGCSNVLDDYAASGNLLRSPKYIFSSGEYIYFQINGIASKGNSFYTLRVQSESDSTGVVINLNETSAGSGIYKNVSGEYLGLGDATVEGSPADTIKVVEEELLTFILLANGQEVARKQVMVDRGEFALVGLRNYSNWAGANDAFSTQASSTLNFISAGDLQYSYSNLSAQHLLDFKNFIKNVGSNASATLEGDFLYWLCHGQKNLCGLADDPNFQQIMYPSDISTSSDWNRDLDFVWDYSCDILNNTCYSQWDNALFGSPRPAHMILGFHLEAYPNSNAVNRFFQEAVTNNNTILDSFLIACRNTSGHPGAAIVRVDNVNDKLKFPTQDSTSTSMRWYRWFTPDTAWTITPYTYSLSREDVRFSAADEGVIQLGDCLVKLASPLPSRPEHPLSILIGRQKNLQSRVAGLNNVRQNFGQSFSYKAPRVDWVQKQAAQTARMLAEQTIASVYGTVPEGMRLAPPAESLALDFAWGDSVDFNQAVPFMSTIQGDHFHNGYQVLEDSISVTVSRNEVIFVKSCWHEIVQELEPCAVMAAEEALNQACMSFLPRASFKNRK